MVTSRMTPITNLKTLTGGIGHAKLVSRHMKFGWLILISFFPYALRTKLKQGVSSLVSTVVNNKEVIIM